MPETQAEQPSIEVRSDFSGFHQLMTHRVESVLMVCSLYESFILEEDGLVADLISSEYLELNLSHAPRVSRVSTGNEALRMMEHQSFDLVMAMTRMGEWDVCEFASTVKRIHPRTRVVVLADEERDLARYQDHRDRDSVNQFFVWSGDAKILLAIIKYIEDALNIQSDAHHGNVRAIILIEDSVKFYSAYLPLIYEELMKLTQTLMSESANRVQTLLRMRARPKILHATTFEHGWQLFETYSDNVLGVISDIRFPREGQPDAQAGLEITRRVKGRSPHMPVLLQSSNPDYRHIARELDAHFIDKNSRTLLAELREFLLENMGFGDFIFRLPDGTEVGRASDLPGMAEQLKKVPEEAIRYHAESNHFSNWLMARTEFDLAMRIRPQRVTDFSGIANLKQYLSDAISGAYLQHRTGIVSDFSRQSFSKSTEFTRLSGGAMGGKARGLAFISSLLNRYKVTDRFDGVRVSVPRLAVIGTDTFDEFLDRNKLHQFIVRDVDKKELHRRFLSAKLPRSLRRDLDVFLDVVNYPLAIRSSSLLEDSHGQPFAGIYETHMLPNCHTSRRVRCEQLRNAIKLVYASTFSRSAKRYLEATNHNVGEEKMGVVIQELVGSQYDDRFYPNFSGVARSYNFYPFGKVKPEDGVVAVALGLGKSVVEGEELLMFSPAHPQSLPQFATPKDALNNSQRRFYALALKNDVSIEDLESEAELMHCSLAVAEEDGTLTPVGSVYSPENNAFYDGINRPGPRLVTFAHVLKSGIFPLTDIVKTLLRLGRRGMASPVEIEFAVNLNKTPKEFNVLQIRPIVSDEALSWIDAIHVDHSEETGAICFSNQTMGNGAYHGLYDIVFIKPDEFTAAKTREMATEVGRINTQLTKEGRRYILIGPGRWGSADPWLGIPVTWDQVSAAQVIVEASLEDYVITPSQGTHFFQNLTSFRIGYMTVNPTAGGGFVDWEWLADQSPTTDLPYVRRISLHDEMQVKLDGRTRCGVIQKPEY